MAIATATTIIIIAAVKIGVVAASTSSTVASHEFCDGGYHTRHWCDQVEIFESSTWEVEQAAYDIVGKATRIQGYLHYRTREIGWDNDNSFEFQYVKEAYRDAACWEKFARPIANAAVDARLNGNLNVQFPEGWLSYNEEFGKGSNASIVADHKERREFPTRTCFEDTDDINDWKRSRDIALAAIDTWTLFVDGENSGNTFSSREECEDTFSLVSGEATCRN